MKVLLGIGGSDESQRALDETVARAAETDDELTIAIFEKPGAERDPDETETTARERLDEAGVDATIRHVDGDPGSRLVQIAEAEEFDQLVIGGGEVSPMGKIQLGSVTEFVLLNAQVTVKLVR
ncbi:Nucleotide-binding universal stress protein, UspA family [Natronoarchaeum philippinense]|uniref:Nucleotide-binding universal stress protein, UspA family n=1 Tax=Natronoarchaeum philippinense TaxID=558529 RepID=A0A285NSW6_NATPI|nr:universal stress protein [Natronoarchaeum philippinense]SNZ12057.1 Nucleotide-binding universal stress protein, UspA family [Natronoarchaeum philippinense]